VIPELAPVEAEPAYRIGDRVLEFDVLLDGIRVVVAQMAVTAVLGGETEVQDDRLGMPIVQVTVGLRRENG
jgi:hypothetical protein